MKRQEKPKTIATRHQEGAIQNGFPKQRSYREKIDWVIKDLGHFADKDEVIGVIKRYTPEIERPSSIQEELARQTSRGKLVRLYLGGVPYFGLPEWVEDDREPKREYLSAVLLQNHALIKTQTDAPKKHEEPTTTGASVAPRKTTTAELVLRVAKKKGRKLRKRDLVAAVIEEDPALQPLSVGALISRMAKRGDLARSKRGKFPLFGPPKEPETAPTEPELQFDETGTPIKSRPPEPEWAEQLRRQHDNAL